MSFNKSNMDNFNKPNMMEKLPRRAQQHSPEMSILQKQRANADINHQSQHSKNTRHDKRHSHRQDIKIKPHSEHI